jgi:hypothetical protein
MSRVSDEKSPYGRRSAKSVSDHTVERFDEPDGDFRRNPPGRADFARPVRRSPSPMRPHRLRDFSYRIGQNRQRRGHDDYVRTA